MGNKLISRSIEKAFNNWKKWKDVYEFKGQIKNNPLLVDMERFKEFLKEYSVNRTIKKGRHDQLRKFLRNSQQFAAALEDKSGMKLDAFERKLRKKFGTHKGKSGFISALSKIAAFLRPGTFVAMDKFSKNGLKKVGEYSGYLSAINQNFKNDLGKEIKKHLKKRKSTEARLGSAFERRVLDVSLMDLGGRWK